MDPINNPIPGAPAPVDPTPAPADPTPAPADPAPADPAPADPAKEAQDRADALQSALDAALEQLNQPQDPKPADPVPAAPATPAPAAPDPVPAAPAAPKEDINEAFSKVMSSIQNVEKKISDLELRDTMIEMTAELRAAIITYPHADENAILAAVESGSDKNIMDLAKESHEGKLNLITDIEKRTEEKVRAQILKENEGKISVPQSAGSSSAPIPGAPGAPSFDRRASDNDDWANALKASKANL
jgi:hypothetical protein